ncbi:MAG: hypothetical protein DCF28_10995 [Alphaproteobacteria bacterium]|nr:MAG: hypothetical protein DCF28_10995 [Alphaproteobacteria bacterium]
MMQPVVAELGGLLQELPPRLRRRRICVPFKRPYRIAAQVLLVVRREIARIDFFLLGRAGVIVSATARTTAARRERAVVPAPLPDDPDLAQVSYVRHTRLPVLQGKGVLESQYAQY